MTGSIPKKYRKIPKDVEAMLIIDYTSMRAAKDWVVANGGYAEVSNLKDLGKEKLFVDTSLGLTEIPRQYYLIKGDLGGFYSYPYEIFNEEYENIP